MDAAGAEAVQRINEVTDLHVLVPAKDETEKQALLSLLRANGVVTPASASGGAAAAGAPECDRPSTLAAHKLPFHSTEVQRGEGGTRSLGSTLD